MSESIVWLDQSEASDVQHCGVKVADLTRLAPKPVGFVISAPTIASMQREGRVNDALSANILHAYHRLIVFGGNYMPFVKVSASPLTVEDSESITINPQLGGNSLIAKIEEMIRTIAQPFAVLVQQHCPTLRLRPYELSDHNHCLEIFRGNVPTFFAPQEEQDFASFLEQPDCPYFVVEHDSGHNGDRDNGIIGCGGYWLNQEKQTAGMVWGMVRKDRHKAGVGSFLLLSRLQAIVIQVANCTVQIGTSQHTYRFFEKFGFTTQKISKNHYGPGLHRYDMQLQMNETSRRSIGKQLQTLSLA